ncbi:hypothetical protein [Streptomyces yangpuensis]|uniref:hypothetical protein n=1 Tax=Streptomyces yangpuensis TaxID=1648182 RepID=UPI0035DBAC7B
MRCINRRLAACVIAGMAFLTACGDGQEVELTSSEPTGFEWFEELTSKVEQNPSQDVGATDLSTSSFQALLNDWRRSRQQTEADLAQRFRDAAPSGLAPSGRLSWIIFKAADLNTFAEDACQKGGPEAAQVLVSKLPGLSVQHGPLIDQTLQLIPLHCTVVYPDRLDSTSDVFFAEMVRNYRAELPEPQDTTPTAAPEPSSTEDQLHYQAVCGITDATLGAFFADRARTQSGKLFGIAAVAGAAVYCPRMLKHLLD